MRSLAFLLLCSGLLASCSARQEIDLQPDGSGTVAVSIELQRPFADWLLSMSEEAKALGLKSQSGALFDEAAIRANVATFPGATVTRLAVPSRDRLEMTLAFADVTALAGAPASGSAAAPFVSLTRSGRRATLRVRLDAAAYGALRPLVPGADNELLDVLGPQQKNPYTEAEYDDVLAFTVGDEAPRWVRASRIDAVVRVPGRVVSQTGGRVEGGAVRFEIPLLDVLLLRSPLVYTIEYEL